MDLFRQIVFFNGAVGVFDKFRFPTEDACRDKRSPRSWTRVRSIQPKTKLESISQLISIANLWILTRETVRADKEGELIKIFQMELALNGITKTMNEQFKKSRLQKSFPEHCGTLTQDYKIPACVCVYHILCVRVTTHSWGTQTHISSYTPAVYQSVYQYYTSFPAKSLWITSSFYSPRSILLPSSLLPLSASLSCTPHSQ